MSCIYSDCPDANEQADEPHLATCTRCLSRWERGEDKRRIDPLHRSFINDAGLGPYLLLGELPNEATQLGECQRRWLGIACILRDHGRELDDSTDENLDLKAAITESVEKCIEIARIVGDLLYALDEVDGSLETVNDLMKGQR